MQPELQKEPELQHRAQPQPLGPVPLPQKSSPGTSLGRRPLLAGAAVGLLALAALGAGLVQMRGPESNVSSSVTATEQAQQLDDALASTGVKGHSNKGGGLMITEVLPNRPASQAGLLPGD